MDIVGPFTASHVHGFKWILVVVDDHSRYKFVKVCMSRSGCPWGLRYAWD